MKNLAFDEINAISSIDEFQKDYSDYAEYFGEMDLSDEEIQKRISFADQFEDVMLFIFALYLLMKRYNRMNEKYLVIQLEEKYSEIASEYMVLDAQMNDHIKEFSQETIDVTKRHEDEYFTSRDRAVILAQNESLTSLNHAQYIDALKKGYTKKIWISERDNRVRMTHKEIDGMEIKIENYFPVGNSLMKYPHDNSSPYIEAKEIINCRCSIKYL